MRNSKVIEYFAYSTLKQCCSLSYIRLLRLEAAQTMESPLHGQLLAYQLHSEEFGPFEALSYTWGSPSAARMIEIDGKRLDIQQNLFDALTTMRFSDQPRFLWIDAICINQADPVEKTHQVSLMGQIYAHAGRVVVYLGKGLCPENDFKAYQLFQWASPFRTRHPWREGRLVWQVPSLSIVLHHFNDLKIDNPFNTSSTPISVSLSDIEQFHARPWFSRRWIVQEVCNARQITVLIGCYALHWQDLSGALDILSRASEDTRSIERQSVQRLLMWKRGVMVESVLEDMEAFDDFEGCDPRDHIAAFLKLRWPNTAPGSDFLVDYSKSVEENYYRLAVHMVDLGKGADVLLAAANCQRIADGDHSLPSWVPDWRTMRRRPLKSRLTGDFDVSIVNERLLKFTGQVRHVFTAERRLYSDSFKTAQWGDVLCCLMNEGGFQDSNHVVLRQSEQSGPYILITGWVEDFSEVFDGPRTEQTGQIRQFLVQ